MAKDHQNIAVVELTQPVGGFSYELGIFLAVVKKFVRSDAEIIAYREKLLHRRKRLAGRNVINIASAVPQVIAHLILGNTLLNSQLGDPVSYKFFIHLIHLKVYFKR